MVLMNLLLNSSRDLDIEKRLMDMAGRGEEEEGGMYGESNMETYIIICLKKKIFSQNRSRLTDIDKKGGGIHFEVGINTYIYTHYM